jgi:hypothetical protein
MDDKLTPRTLARISVYQDGLASKRTKVLPCSNASARSLQEALLNKLCSDHFGMSYSNLLHAQNVCVCVCVCACGV